MDRTLDSAAMVDPVRTADIPSDLRREGDSNPRALAGQGFSRASHSSALPSLRAPGYASQASPICDRSSRTQSSALRQAASTRARTAGPWSPAAG